jgi:predicted Kef-type K+ transport protein
MIAMFILLLVYGLTIVACLIVQVQEHNKRTALKALIKPIQIVSHSPIIVSIDNAKQR